jgi:hypothetical protein
MATLQVVADQINRLKSRFGDKAFDDEFVKLVKAELRNMVDGNVTRCCDLFIGNRPHHKPPVLDDFRQARLAEEKVKVEYAARGAMDAMTRGPAGNEGLKRYLAKAFPGCKTLNEAIEVRRHQIEIAKANDPTYDPMKDPLWN